MPAPYPSSVPGSASSKFGTRVDFYNDFGCACDGTTDDTTKAQNALNSIAGKSKYIYIPHGRNLAVNHLSIPDGIVIAGDGPSSWMTFIGSAPTTALGRIDVPSTTSNWGLENFSIDGGVTTPVGVDYANISSPMALTLVGGGNGLPIGSSVWVHGGSTNGYAKKLNVKHGGGYTIVFDATTGNISGMQVSQCRIYDTRPNLFGVTSSGGLNYGSWTGGIHYESDGTTYTVSDLLVEFCTFLRVTGHCFWGHAGALSLLNSNIRFLNNFAQDHGLDMVEMGAVNTFQVIGNKSSRCGYISLTDGAVGTPKWGTVAPASIDHTGLCANGTISNNTVDACNGTAIDGDGITSTNLTGNTLTSSWASSDPNAQSSSCGPYGHPAGTNLSVGFNPGNTNNDSRVGINVNFIGNTLSGFGAGAARFYVNRFGKVQGNLINHPTNAVSSPIVFGPGALSNQRCYGNDISANTAYWTPPTGAPMVAEDAEYSAFLSTEVNYVYDNTAVSTIGSPVGLVYQFAKALSSSSTTGAKRYSSVSAQAPTVCEFVAQTEHSLVGGTDAQLKFYKNVPYGSWAANFAWQVGQGILDSSSHIQIVTAASGNSGSSTPAWNHSGGTTTDGGVTWTDRGVLLNSNVATFTDTTAGFPSLTISGNGAIDNVRNFTGNSMTLYGAVTGGAPQNLVLDNAANAFLRSLAIGTTTPYDLISNTSSNIQDAATTGTTHGHGITWSGSSTGYMAGIANTLNDPHADGILIQVINASARALTVNVAGSDLFLVNGQGFVTAQAYSVGANGVIDASRNFTGNSLTISGATPSLVVDGSANLAGRSLTLGPLTYGTSFDLLSNSTSNIVDSQGSPIGTTHGFGITWRNSATGYMWAVENYDNAANANGLLIKVANSSTRILTLNVGGSDLIAASGNGNWTAISYSLAGSGIVDSSRNFTGHSYSIDGHGVIIDSSGNGSFGSVAGGYCTMVGFLTGGQSGFVGYCNTGNGYMVAGTAVIDSGRNGYFQTVSCSTLFATTFSPTNVAATGYVTANGVIGSGTSFDLNGTPVIVYSGGLTFCNLSYMQVNSGTVVDQSRNGYFTSVSISTTQVIDNSRNIVNAGSGAFSGGVQAGSFAINGFGTIITASRQITASNFYINNGSTYTGGTQSWVDSTGHTITFVGGMFVSRV